MAELQTALSLIQVVALFLPAWAILLQIFSKAISELDLESNPTVIPFVASIFVLSLASLYLFGRGSFYIMAFLFEQGAVGDGSLSKAFTDLMSGGLVFTMLGFLVLWVVGQNKFSYEEFRHISIVAIALGAFLWIG